MAKKRVRRGRWVIVDGVKFMSIRPGYYLSDCGRWAIVHMLAGLVNHQWELWTTQGRSDNNAHNPVDLVELVDTGFSMGDFLYHVARGELVLRSGR